jgi:hypothetical protein
MPNIPSLEMQNPSAIPAFLALHLKITHSIPRRPEFLKTANWRREQAIDYPDDKWNFEAVVLLERLANTVDEIDPRLLEAYVGLWERDGLSGAETQTEMLRGVAFNWAPQTASEFVSEFSKMTSGT